MTTLPRTPLHGVQARRGARFGEVDGWEVALAFAGMEPEIEAARHGTVLVDRSHQGRLRLTGSKRLNLLHRLSTQDLRALPSGQGARAAMLTDKGRILDDLRVYVFEDHVVLITSPGRAETIRRHIESLRFRDDVTVEDITATTALLLLAGPRAAGLLSAGAEAAGEEAARGDAPAAPAPGSMPAQSAGAVPSPAAGLPGLPRHHHRAIRVGGSLVTAARAAGLHDAAFRLLIPAGAAAAVWESLAAAGGSHGAQPAGEEAHEVRRIERGVPRQGRELTEDHNPLEARLDDAISWTKGCYIGQEVVARLDSRQKVSRLLCGLRLEPSGAGAVRPGDAVEDPARAGVQAGRVTSVAAPPGSGPIALAYARQELSSPGTPVMVLSAGGARVTAVVTDLPFPQT